MITAEAPVSLRRALGPDVPRLLPMMNDFNALEQIALSPHALEDALERLVTEDELGRVWFIDAGPETVGYAVLTFGYDLEFAGRDAFLTELYLVPQEHGRGIGRAALMAVEAAAEALGVNAIHLMVRPENVAAARLYAAAGYESPPRTMLSKTLRRP